MYNHHNPDHAQPIMNQLIAALGDKWEDVSYGNDSRASIIRYDEDEEGFIQIFIPNSVVGDDAAEQHDKFQLNVSDKYYPEYNTIEAVLEAVSMGIDDLSDMLEAIDRKE